MFCIERVQEIQPVRQLVMLADRPWHGMQGLKSSMQDRHTDGSVRHAPPEPAGRTKATAQAAWASYKVMNLACGCWSIV